MKSKKLPHYLIEKNNLIVQVTISVLFAIAFLAVYIPLSNTTTSWFSLEDPDKFMYTAFFIIFSTIFLIFSRVMMFYMSKRLIRFTLPKYIFWMLGEIALIGLFHAYISLGIIHVEDYVGDYSKALIIGKSILITFIALGFPFIVTDLSFALLDAQRVLRIAKGVIQSNENDAAKTQKNATSEPMVTDTPDIVNFHDYTGALKFTVKLENIYYIKAEGNYVNVFYNNKGGISSFVLRNKIQTIEDNLAGTPLMRCHRTYIVNTNNIKLIRTEDEGYYIDFNQTGLESVPVSNTYREKIVKRFTEL
ncbi:MAG: LytTR family transcriptional regulator [Bacteroidales bacterium]|nr:LytTR family transcriptional regulator [Bacteroidales bacterium]MBQ7533584.1 LytTR family transcriptional regulator [Bacteroidales bacterium]